jgi:hypothetical protein
VVIRLGKSMLVMGEVGFKGSTSILNRSHPFV